MSDQKPTAPKDAFESLRVECMTIDELSQLHGLLAGAFQVMGLRGPIVDCAVSDAIRTAYAWIAYDRESKSWRRETLKVVSSGLADEQEAGQ